MTKINITGTLIKNYYHCKRQAWLYYYGLNFQNEKTKTGQIQHKEKNEEEFIIDNIKIDNIDFKNKQIIEYKKSSSNIQGSIMQTIYYLYILKQKGLKFKAKVKDLDFGDEYDLELNSENENKLVEFFKEIEDFLKKEIPKPIKKKECRNCSFYEYCFS